MKPRLKGSIAAATFALAIGGLSACGSSDPGGNIHSSPAGKQIQSLISRHYEMPSCDDLTPAGRRAFDHPVADGPCEKDIASQAPANVTVTEVEVSGDTGTAVANDFNFDVEKIDGEWKIDGGG